MKKAFRKDILIVLDAAEKVAELSEPRKSYDYKKTSNGSVTSFSTKNNVYIIPELEGATYSKGLFDNLESSAAKKVALIIGDDLCFNNALWYFDHKNNRTLVNGLKELKKKKVIFLLTKNIYYVNPLCIRKGNPVTVAEKTKEEILEARGACKEIIKPLNSKLKGYIRLPIYGRNSEFKFIPDFLKFLEPENLENADKGKTKETDYQDE